MDQQFDKRRHERLIYRTPVTIESLESGINESARMINFSDNGLYFQTDELLQPGMEVFIGIRNSPYRLSESYECYLAKIKWGKRLKNAPLAYGYGANYVDIKREKDPSQNDLEEKEDKRKHARKFFAKPAIFRYENKSYEGFITNISYRGCFIKNRGFFESGQILHLYIPGTKIDEDNMLKAEIVRLSPNGVGVKFKGMLNKRTKE